MKRLRPRPGIFAIGGPAQPADVTPASDLRRNAGIRSPLLGSIARSYVEHEPSALSGISVPTPFRPTPILATFAEDWPDYQRVTESRLCIELSPDVRPFRCVNATFEVIVLILIALSTSLIPRRGISPSFHSADIGR